MWWRAWCVSAPVLGCLAFRLAAWSQGGPAPAGTAEGLRRYFRAAGVVPAMPWRAMTSGPTPRSLAIPAPAVRSSSGRVPRLHLSVQDVVPVSRSWLRPLGRRAVWLGARESWFLRCVLPLWRFQVPVLLIPQVYNYVGPYARPYVMSKVTSIRLARARPRHHSAEDEIRRPLRGTSGNYDCPAVLLDRPKPRGDVGRGVLHGRRKQPGLGG